MNNTVRGLYTAILSCDNKYMVRYGKVLFCRKGECYTSTLSIKDWVVDNEYD